MNTITYYLFLKSFTYVVNTFDYYAYIYLLNYLFIYQFII